MALSHLSNIRHNLLGRNRMYTFSVFRKSVTMYRENSGGIFWKCFSLIIEKILFLGLKKMSPLFRLKKGDIFSKIVIS